MSCFRAILWFGVGALMVSGARPALPAEFHVAPNGRESGDGSEALPWDLQTALSHPEAVAPGDTLWLHGGTYRGSFFSQLKGAAGKPIVVRQAPGERAIIDIEPVKRGVGFHAHGQWVRFQGFQITCTNPKRRTEQTGSWPTDVRRGSIESRGDYLQWVNLAVHDLGKGFGFWRSGAGGEIYGCLIYNNGWGGPDRGHGHAIYAQNAKGTKRIVDNIVFNQFANGIDIYGSTKSVLKGFHIEGNVAFHNGCLYKPGSRMSNLRAGGECPLEDVTIKGNFTFDGGAQVGYPWGKTNYSATVTDNYLVGGMAAYYQGELVFERNTVIGQGPIVRLTTDRPHDAKRYAINRNTYYLKPTPFGTFALGSSLEVSAWRALGFDTESQIHRTVPENTLVFVRENQYEQGRANIVIYNWAWKESVAVDLSKVLTPGRRFRIMNAQHPFGEPIVADVFDGASVQIPMQPTPPVQPIGMQDYELPISQPVFGVFLVLSD